jgi:hypothetical protein
MSIQGFHQIIRYFYFHINTEAQPASETRFSFKKIKRRTKTRKERGRGETFSLRDELCKIGLGYVELETYGTDLKVMCRITKTGCGVYKKNERKRSLVSYCNVKQDWREGELYMSRRNINVRNGLARFRFEIWKAAEIRTGIKEGKILYVIKLKMTCSRYVFMRCKETQRSRENFRTVSVYKR